MAVLSSALLACCSHVELSADTTKFQLHLKIVVAELLDVTDSQCQLQLVLTRVGRSSGCLTFVRNF